MNDDGDHPDEYDDEDEWVVQEAMLAALDAPGEWPARSSARTGPVTVVDIDRVDDCAIVLAVTEGNTKLFEQTTLYRFVFERTPDGWSWHGGSGCGGEDDPLDDRARWVPGQPHLIESASGWSRWEGRNGRQRRLYEIQLLCGPDVARVEIVRGAVTRVADVATGPGWLVVAWTDAAPTVVAFDGGGRQLEVLSPQSHEQTRARRRRWGGQPSSPEKWRRTP